MTTLDAFIDNLHLVEVLPLSGDMDRSLNASKDKDVLALVYKVIEGANALLVTSEGRCDWGNIDFLKEHGFSVGPGEQDRFGWLTGMIYTKKGHIMYG